MSQLLSIRERIELVLVGIVQGISGIGKVYRLDDRGILDPTTNKPVTMTNGDALVAAGDESASEGGQGSVGITHKTLHCAIGLVVQLDETDERNASYVKNNWLLAIETAVMANAFMVEPTTTSPAWTGQQLAIDTRTVATHVPTPEQESTEFDVLYLFEVDYDHDRNDPAQYGSAITHRTI